MGVIGYIWVEVGVKDGGDWIHLGRGGDGGGSSNARVLHTFGVGPTVQLQWGHDLMLCRKC